jgi:hypothetical protein
MQMSLSKQIANAVVARNKMKTEESTVQMIKTRKETKKTKESSEITREEKTYKRSVLSSDQS